MFFIEINLFYLFNNRGGDNTRLPPFLSPDPPLKKFKCPQHLVNPLAIITTSG